MRDDPSILTPRMLDGKQQALQKLRHEQLFQEGRRRTSPAGRALRPWQPMDPDEAGGRERERIRMRMKMRMRMRMRVRVRVREKVRE